MQASELYTIINYLRSKQDKLQREVQTLQQTIDSLQRTIDKLPADEVSSEAPVISSTYAPSDLENTALTKTFAYTPESADLSGKNLTRAVDYIRSLIS